MVRRLSVFLLAAFLSCFSVEINPISAAYEPPVITRQPQNNVFPEGASAYWTVEAYGTNLHYYWYLEVNGTVYDLLNEAINIPELNMAVSYGPNEAGNGYVIDGIDTGLDGAEIYCSVEDGHNFVVSSPAVIQVVSGISYPPEVAVPAEITAEVGQPAGIYCSASDYGNGVLSYQWYTTDSGRLQDIRALAGENDATLNLNSSAESFNYYVCMVENDTGGRSYTSVVPVRIISSKSTPVPSAEPVKIEALEIYTDALPSASFQKPYECRIYTSDSAAVFRIASQPGMLNEFGLTGLAFMSDGTIKGLPSRAGSFTFTIIAEAGAARTQKTYTLVITSELLKINLQPSSSTVTEGETAQFVCQADGAKSYQWYHASGNEAGAVFTMLNDSGGISGAATGTLKIKSEMTMNGDRFRCELTDQQGAKVMTESAVLNVIGRENKVKGSGESVTIPLWILGVLGGLMAGVVLAFLLMKLKKRS